MKKSTIDQQLEKVISVKIRGRPTRPTLLTEIKYSVWEHLTI